MTVLTRGACYYGQEKPTGNPNSETQFEVNQYCSNHHQVMKSCEGTPSEFVIQYVLHFTKILSSKFSDNCYSLIDYIQSAVGRTRPVVFDNVYKRVS